MKYNYAIVLVDCSILYDTILYDTVLYDIKLMDTVLFEGWPNAFACSVLKFFKV